MEDYIQSWSRRLTSPIAEYVILWLSAYDSEPTYPYSIHSKLVDLWDKDHAPALQSIYATIRRLEKDGYIQSNQEISPEGRTQKILNATKKGMIVVDEMQNLFQGVADTIRRFEIR